MMDEDTKKKVGHRLKKIEGQVAALSRMVAEDDYCVDVLTQISAAQGALARVGQILLASHIETCVRAAFEHGDASARQLKVDELMDVFQRFAKVGTK